jgi:hypothetical protein
MSERKKKAISLLQDFIKEMDSFLKSLGDMSLTEDQIGLAPQSIFFNKPKQ